MSAFQTSLHTQYSYPYQPRTRWLSRWRRRVCVGLAGVLLALVTASTAQAGAVDPAVKSFRAANGFLSRGMNELAIEEYRLFLNASPRHEKVPTAQYGLGVALFRLSKYADSIAALGQISIDDTDFPFAAETLLIRGQSHLALGDSGRAAAELGELVSQYPSHESAGAAHALLVEALHRSGAHAQAVKSADEFLAQNRAPDRRERVAFFAALSLVASGDYASASDRLQTMLDAQPEGELSDRGELLLAQCLQQQGFLEQALRKHENVLSRKSAALEPDALFGAGSALVGLNRFQEATPALEQLLSRYPENELSQRARVLLARAYLAQDDAQRAARAIEPVAAEDASLGDDRAYWLAKAAMARGDDAEAVRQIGRALDWFPKSELRVSMLYDLGVAQRNRGKLNEAREALVALLKSDPDANLAAPATHLLAHTLHELDQFDESLALCEQFAQAFPQHELGRSLEFLRAENLYLSGERQVAIDAYTAFLQKYDGSPESRDATYRLGMALYQEGRYEQAWPILTIVSKSNAADGRRSASLLALGEIAFSERKWANAEAALREHLELVHPGDASETEAARLKLALAIVRQDRPQEAAPLLSDITQEAKDDEVRLHARFELAQALSTLERDEEAEQLFARVVEEAPESRFALHARRKLADMAMARGDNETAQTLLAEVGRAAQDDALLSQTLFAQAQALMGSGKYAEAGMALDAALLANPEMDAALTARAQRAVCAARAGDGDEALKLFDVFSPREMDLLEEPLRAALLYERGYLLRQRERDDEAAQAYRQLLGLERTDALSAHAILDLADIASNRGEYEEALGYLDQFSAMLASATAPKVTAQTRAQALYRQAAAAYRLGQLKRAAPLFDAFLAEFSDHELAGSALLLAGESHLAQGHHSEAANRLARFANNYKQDENLPAALLRLGEAYAALQDWPSSYKAFNARLKRFPDDPLSFQAQFGRGWALENQQQYDEAIQDYSTIVASHDGPTAARAQFQIGESLFAQNKYSEATRELLKVDILYAYPEWSAAALYEAARCFRAMGDEAQASSHFQRVIDEHAETEWAALATRELASAAPDGNGRAQNARAND